MAVDLSLVLGFPHRQLYGEEYQKIWCILKLCTPYHSSNNQHTMTDQYRIGNTRYDVIYGFTDDPIIEEIDDQSPRRTS